MNSVNIYLLNIELFTSKLSFEKTTYRDFRILTTYIIY